MSGEGQEIAHGAANRRTSGRTRSQVRPANVAGQQFSRQSANASPSTHSSDDILQSVVLTLQQQQQMLMAMADTQLRAAGTPAPPSAANARALSVAKRIEIPVLASPNSLDIVAFKLVGQIIYNSPESETSCTT